MSFKPLLVPKQRSLLDATTALSVGLTVTLTTLSCHYLLLVSLLCSSGGWGAEAWSLYIWFPNMRIEEMNEALSTYTLTSTKFRLFTMCKG